MKKKKVHIARLELQKMVITALNADHKARVWGGGSLGCAEPVSGEALSCIGHGCESWNSERPSCWHCAEV